MADEYLTAYGPYTSNEISGNATPPQPEPVSDAIPRCGDHVRHIPSSDDWLVAYADPATNTIAWAGGHGV